jgi:PIN domain nuclease of toxin-antitoxin system
MLISEVTDTDLLVLDTHVWVWASGEAEGTSQLGAAALPAIERAARGRRLFVSAASVWEIALKAERGQAFVSGDLHAWVRDQRRYPGVRVLPIGSRIAVECTRLPRWTRRRDGREHRDPGDRFIVTTTRRLNGVVLTCDDEILAYAQQGHVKAYDAC